MDALRAQTPVTVTSHPLHAGVLTLRKTAPPGPELFRIAERINPKRAFLFVSTVLGRHIPVDPVAHRAALRTLSDGVSKHLLPGAVFVMGFAETAVGIGAGVFDCLQRAHPGRAMGYLPTTRFAPVGETPWFTIEESHSHAVDHIILRPAPGVLHSGADATLVLVDDETTTGKTFAELAGGLRDQGLIFGRVVLVTLTDWSDGRAGAAVRGIFGAAEVRDVSLQQGAWDWAPKPGFVQGGLPGGCPPTCPLWHPARQQAFGAPRFGIAAATAEPTGADLLAGLENAGLPTPTGRVLVVGAGEHVWQPMLVAEACVARGLFTRFITTTRSPILQGGTIRHKTTFPDHYGEGFQMYMHNVDPAGWDRILLFTETGFDGVPPQLTEWLGDFDVIDGTGAVR